METADFLSLVLAREGVRCVAAVLPDGKMRHMFFHTNDEAAHAIKQLDARGLSVYFACATFIKQGSRAGANALAARSFWLDIDCGAGKPYASAKEGVRALSAFCTTVALPLPTIISSGNGIHAYWTLTADVEPSLWRKIAQHLRMAAQIEQFEVDNARTTDIASILRPVGSHNRKGEPKPVRQVNVAEDIELSVFAYTLQQHLSAAGVSEEAAPTDLNSDLSAGQEYPPAFAERIANGCGVMAMMRDSQGNLDQPTWYAMLGVLAFCEDGEELAHEWSAGHPQYTAEETSTKLAQASKFRPTTCQKIATCQSAVCSGCRHAGNIKSPIVLGFETQPVPVQTSTEDEEQLLELPDGYRWAPLRQGQEPSLQYSLLDADGNTVWFPFCHALFYPIARIRTPEGMVMEIEMEVRNGQKKQFTIPCSTIARGGADLAYELGKHEIVASGPRMKPQIEAYLQRWLDRNRTRAEEIVTYGHFGWHEDDFLVGQTLITPAANKRVLLGGDAKVMANYLGERGSFEVWRDVVNEAYNYPGQEGLQYLIVTAFAAPLLKLFKQYGGVTVYAHSEGSGVGKTTAQRVGLSAWGNWSALQLTDKQVTVTGLYNTIGALCNLPVVFDELTNMNNGFASDLVYNVSNGQGKVRANKDGTLQLSPHKWATIMMASGNTLLTEKVSVHRANAEAELSRIFEFSLEAQSRLTPARANELFPLLADNYGHAGRMFAEYVVRNRDKVTQILSKVQQQFNTEVEILQNERFWSALHCCQLVALKICNQLGILSFPIAPFKQWIGDQLTLNRIQRKEVANDPIEIFGRMLADHWQGILVTQGEGDMRKNLSAEVLQHPKGTLHGRAILPLDPNERAVLLLNSATIREWCNKKGCSLKEMFAAVIGAGLCRARQERYSLGRGTNQYGPVSSQVKCWVIELSRLSGMVDPAIAQKLKVVDSTAIGEGGA